MKLVRIAVAVHALALLGIAQAPPVPSSYSPEQQLFKLLNLERENAGVGKLQWDSNVAQAAMEHARKLAENAALSHRFPGEAQLDQRVGATGARFNAVAENVALADTPEDAHVALMNSPGHRANILNPEYNAVGIAVVQRGRTLYIAQDFARVLPAYSDQQFREEIVAVFNRLRQAHHNGPIEFHPDSRLDQEACSGKPDPGGALQMTGGSRAAVFTASRPSDLPGPMVEASADFTLHRMNLGVCFKPDSKGGFAHFWVVAVFFTGR
jgi:uncharacterized protein YkwD